MRKRCASCGSYISPPDTYRGRPDVGYCEQVGKVNERSYCNYWQAKPLEA